MRHAARSAAIRRPSSARSRCYVAMPGAQGGPQGNPARPKAEAIPGDAETLAAALRAFAAEGIGHVQLVLDPITADSIRALAPALALLDA